MRMRSASIGVALHRIGGWVIFCIGNRRSVEIAGINAHASRERTVHCYRFFDPLPFSENEL